MRRGGARRGWEGICGEAGEEYSFGAKIPAKKRKSSERQGKSAQRTCDICLSMEKWLRFTRLCVRLWLNMLPAPVAVSVVRGGHVRHQSPSNIRLRSLVRSGCGSILLNDTPQKFYLDLRNYVCHDVSLPLVFDPARVKVLNKQGSTPTPWARGLRDQIQKWALQTRKTLYF